MRTQPAQSELSFANAMHQLDTGDRDDGVSEILETQHHSDPLLHSSVVLLDQVVQDFDGIAKLAGAGAGTMVGRG